ncbi:hypothetical protein SPRG_19878 [Saprolegnia parasitica CBS 223.65]|uniref:Uncharacterized protein n=1 Tax=Saprolegnia parasitica (strain CBS 223.65) TaxID=695850 RepID=A0A067CJ73_SAPPC|nr:hypothetical protein SPRG_19878 [Saprolegnia parasitica CBS 223.65]KDO29205.1 hypothetical protein SPRG_19878 [Saprolegnia parasitica CBS 223.65]|eukprot:XP_012200105.1 hypothetical protein SPRG_19878 [Saprolegnia parasitica CBS 223.65]
MQVARSARLARVADRRAVQLCAKDGLVAACVAPRLLHCIADGRVHTIVKAPAAIVAVEIMEDAILVATATGHIWSVAKPTASANTQSTHHIITLARAPDAAQDLLIDKPLGAKHRRSSASPSVAPIVCLPGVQSLCAIDASTFVATSNIFPTTVFSSPHAPVELEELEGDQSTCIVARPAAGLSRWLLARMKAPETAQHVLLQGDRDGSVRFAVLSAARALLCAGVLYEASSAIQGIVPLSASLAIADASGNMTLLTPASSTSWKESAIQRIAYVPGCAALVYCTLDGALSARAVSNDTLHPPVALPLPPDVVALCSNGESAVTCLMSNGQLLVLKLPPSMAVEPMHEGYGKVGMYRRAGTDRSIKAQLDAIQAAADAKASLLITSKALDRSLTNLGAAFGLLQRVQAHGLASVVACTVTTRRRHEPSLGFGSASNEDMLIGVTFEPTNGALSLEQWVLHMTVSHSTLGSNMREFSIPCPPSLGSSWSAHVPVISSALLRVTCRLVFLVKGKDPLVLPLDTVDVHLLAQAAPWPGVPRQSQLSAAMLKQLYVPRPGAPCPRSLWAPAGMLDASIAVQPLAPLLWTLHLSLDDPIVLDGTRAVLGVRVHSGNVVVLLADHVGSEVLLTLGVSDASDLSHVRASVLSHRPPAAGGAAKAAHPTCVAAGCYEALLQLETKWTHAYESYVELFAPRRICAVEARQLLEALLAVEAQLCDLYWKVRKITNVHALA